MKQVILDTDIGTDVDDSIALLQILTELDESNLFLTTVYGDALLRSKIASSYIELVGCSVAVFPGANDPLSNREIYYSGYEGMQFDRLNDEHVKLSTAQDAIISSIHQHAETEIIAIGPLTNIASVVLSDPTVQSRLGHIYVMGGRFLPGKPEHNMLCDIEAAKIVFQSGIPITIVGIEQTQRLEITLRELENFEDRPDFIDILFKEIELWCNHRNANYIVPHDSLAVLLMTNPGIFTLSPPGMISINNYETVFTESTKGNHQYVIDFDVEAARTLILKALGSQIRSRA